MEIKFENSIIVELCFSRQCLAACLSCLTMCLLQIPHDRTFVLLVWWLCIFHTLSFLFSFTFLQNLSLRCGILYDRLFLDFHPLFLFPPLIVNICKSCVRLSYWYSYVSATDFFLFSYLVMKNNFSYFFSI